MIYSSVSVVTFSPAKTPNKVIDNILEGLNLKVSRYLDCTKPEKRKYRGLWFVDELVVLSTPVN